MATVAGTLDDVFQGAAELDARLASVAALLSRLDSNGATSPDGASVMAPLLTAPALVRRVYHDLWSALAGMQASDWQRAGELLFALWDKCLAALRYVEQGAELLDQRRGAVPVDQLKALIVDTQRERDDAF